MLVIGTGSIFKAAKRALVIALRHQQLSVDVVNEEDVVARKTLEKYHLRQINIENVFAKILK